MPFKMPDSLKAELLPHAKACRLILIEVFNEGRKAYVRGTSCWGYGLTEDVTEATNYGAAAKEQPFSRGEYTGDEAFFATFEKLWHDLATIYVKDVGGAKSGIRSDIPGKIVVFDAPTRPPCRAIFFPDQYKD